MQIGRTNRIDNNARNNTNCQITVKQLWGQKYETLDQIIANYYYTSQLCEKQF